MGTGARLLGKSLRTEGVKKVYVAMTHTHMDHMIGLPYFDPIFDPECKVHMGLPAASSTEARERVGKYLNGVFHPLALDDLGSNLKYYGVPSGETVKVGPYTLSTIRLVHPGGTLGYRVRVGEHWSATSRIPDPLLSRARVWSLDTTPPSSRRSSSRLSTAPI